MVDGPVVNGTLNKVSSNVPRSSWGECFLSSSLQKFFEIILHLPDVNK
jgi:hypothetical protein